MSKTKLEILARCLPYPEVEGEKPWFINPKGQAARTLLHAIQAQADNKGFTSLEISTWALRLSHYIYLLRNDGLTITMEREDHDGPVGDGWHGRYRLKNRVEIIEVRGATGRRAAA